MRAPATFSPLSVACRVSFFPRFTYYLVRVRRSQLYDRGVCRSVGALPTRDDRLDYVKSASSRQFDENVPHDGRRDEMGSGRILIRLIVDHCCRRYIDLSINRW
jgi:hypothetical protein